MPAQAWGVMHECACDRRIARKIGFDLPPDERGPSGRVGFLESILPKGGIGAEVGVHKGYFTPVLL